MQQLGNMEPFFNYTKTSLLCLLCKMRKKKIKEVRAISQPAKVKTVIVERLK